MINTKRQLLNALLEFKMLFYETRQEIDDKTNNTIERNLTSIEKQIKHF